MESCYRWCFQELKFVARQILHIKYFFEVACSLKRMLEIFLLICVALSCCRTSSFGLVCYYWTYCMLLYIGMLYVGSLLLSWSEFSCQLPLRLSTSVFVFLMSCLPLCFNMLTCWFAHGWRTTERDKFAFYDALGSHRSSLMTRGKKR